MLICSARCCINILPLNSVNHTLLVRYSFSNTTTLIFLLQLFLLYLSSYRTSVLQILPSFQPTSPNWGLLGAAGLLDHCLCLCPTPHPLAGPPTWQLPPPGLPSAPSGCWYLKRTSPVWRHVSQQASSVSQLTSASSTTRRLCAG